MDENIAMDWLQIFRGKCRTQTKILTMKIKHRYLVSRLKQKYFRVSLVRCSKVKDLQYFNKYTSCLLQPIFVGNGLGHAQ